MKDFFQQYSIIYLKCCHDLEVTLLYKGTCKNLHNMTDLILFVKFHEVIWGRCETKMYLTFCTHYFRNSGTIWFLTTPPFLGKRRHELKWDSSWAEIRKNMLMFLFILLGIMLIMLISPQLFSCQCAPSLTTVLTHVPN